MASSTGWRPYKTSIHQVYFLNRYLVPGLRMFIRQRSAEQSSVPGVFKVNISFFMDHSTKNRVFSGRKSVSDTVQIGTITLAASQAAQVQSENAAIAHGLK